VTDPLYKSGLAGVWPFALTRVVSRGIERHLHFSPILAKQIEDENHE
jgi:hypothetical protein